MRLDVFLAENGYFQSRSKAQEAIKEGLVSVNGALVRKHSFLVENDAVIDIISKDRYVSRAGEKLAHAVKEFDISVEGLTALDIGASTGGFTDCLLQNGAKRVYALDVGRAQLDQKLRADSRVTVIEGFNARNARKTDFETEIDIIVMDVSFISQTLIYPAADGILKSGSYMITLVKPQFEAGRENIGKGGIVKDTDGSILKKILKKIDGCADENGFERIGFTQSPILGGDGNREYLALFKKI